MRLTSATAARKHVRSSKTYRLTRRLPRTERQSIARAILVAISRARGTATTQSLRRAMKRGASDATLRFYLGKFQREGLVVSEGL